MKVSYTHGREFARQIQPLLEWRDCGALQRHLRRYWPPETLRGLLTCGHTDGVKTALVCFSVVGTMEDNTAVARMLHDEDAEIAALAEHALWAIWLRAGDPAANADLAQAVRLLSEDRIEQAIGLLRQIVAQYPDFAEAHNQLAIALFLNHEYVPAIESCRHALRLNPYHFGAMAGLGHCHASRSEWDPALEAYHEALRVHPRLEGIRQSIQQICEIARRRRTSNVHR